MHQAGWMRRRLHPVLTIPVSFSKFFIQTRCLAHLLPARPLRDNSSFRRKLVPRARSQPELQARNVQPTLIRGSTVKSSTPTGLQAVNGSSSPFPSKHAVTGGLTVQRARSRNSLYKNLLRLLSTPSSSSVLPTLLDYHEMHPGLRSARSYNLLIWLAIRHAAFGTVQALLSGMTADGIAGNFETHKLKIRWFVTVGQPKPIPLPLWLEFFHHTNAVKASSRAVRIVIRAMLSVKRANSAFLLATRYFDGLPRYVSAKWAAECVAIMDAIVAFEARRRGLLDFYSARRKLNSLLAIHPSFRPTPKTLYILLSTLRQAKQCGTVAARWGPQVEDRRVRRRVASYAIKERRLDIVDKVFEAEHKSRQQGTERDAGTPERLKLGSRPRELVLRRGYESWLWKRLGVRRRLLRTL
ncbi:hypothetical protein C8J57DRAFT_1269195 [Mycena rebaudengoi]|nr:hypothetical protein C8J57DRAFT_1269195 [Mycena rebaudengoi]